MKITSDSFAEDKKFFHSSLSLVKARTQTNGKWTSFKQILICFSLKTFSSLFQQQKVPKNLNCRNRPNIYTDNSNCFFFFCFSRQSLFIDHNFYWDIFRYDKVFHLLFVVVYKIVASSTNFAFPSCPSIKDGKSALTRQTHFVFPRNS